MRIPAWAGRNTKVTVNGKPIDTALTPGTRASIDRTWKDGDRIEPSLDMPLRLTPIDERHPQVVALLYGPVALFAIDPAAQRIGNSTVWRVATGSGNARMIPFPEIKEETYRLYQQI